MKIIEYVQKRSDEFPEAINEVITNKIQSHSTYLTRYREDSSIEKIGNTAEEMIYCTSTKSIEKNYLTVDGFLSRFNTKIERLKKRNKVFLKDMKNTPHFYKAPQAWRKINNNLPHK
ncbi:MAG: hypothetical protein Q4Q22_01205 [Methanosphaera sp.]|nr:hypothetical protein [Methanosphaera sp.]